MASIQHPREPIRDEAGNYVINAKTGKRVTRPILDVWRARYRDAAGKEHTRHFKLKREAQQWLNEVTASVVTGQYVDPRAGEVTWASWVTLWMSRQAWVPGTVDAALTAVDSVPWANEPIRGVRASQIQGWVSGEVKRGLAASTVRTRLNYVQMCFRAAVLDKVIPASPAVSVKAPRVRRQEAAMKLLTADEVGRALEAAGDFHGFVAVCAFAGLRLGEAAGLQLRDVNWLGRSITISRQVQGSTIKGATLVPPKYGSEGTVYIPDELVTMLSAHVAEHRITQPEQHLFTTVLGRLWNRNNAAEEWRRIRTEARLQDDVTLHALRHTFASNLIASGCDVVTVQRAMRHATPSITLNVYSHLWPKAEDKTRAATAVFMGQIRGSADSLRTPDGKAQIRG